METYIKIKTESHEVGQLQAEINSNIAIIPSCTSIVSDGTNLYIEFTAAISTNEETQLDSLVANHVPYPKTVDVAQLPFSMVDEAKNKKLSVHPSYKPQISNGTTYAVWSGAGDDIVSNPSKLGDGELCQFSLSPGISELTKDIKFDHTRFGRVWVHEAYLKFSDGGIDDYISAYVVANPTTIQTSVNLDIVLVGNEIKPASGGAGTGTHGFAAQPLLVPRLYLKDGAWDYDGVNLIPNLTDTGEYKIFTTESIVHKYVNKISVFGNSPYFSMSSDETAEVNAGYFLRVTAFNNSNTSWNASILLELYRETTIEY